MSMDLRTLAAVLTLAFGLQAGVLWIQYRTSPSQPGLGWWTGSSAVLTLGFLANGLRAVPRLRPLAILVNDASFMAGMGLVDLGVRHFFGRPVRLRVPVAGIGGALLLAAWWTFGDDNLSARRVLLSGAVALFAFLAVWELLRHRRRPVPGPELFLALLFSAYGGFFLVRAGAAFRVSPAPELFQAAPMQTLTYLVAFAGGLLWNFGFILLLNQRLIATSRDARDQLEAIFRTSPDAAFIARVDDHRVAELNAGFTALTGLGRARVLGRRLDDLDLWADPVDRARMAELLARCEPVHHLELAFRSRDGRKPICLVSAEPVALHGQPHLLIVASDITDQKRAEETLKSSNLFLSDMFENNGALIYVKDLAGRYQSVNRKWEEVTGLSRDAVLQRLDVELFRAETGQAWNRMDQEVMSQARVLEEEEVLAGPQGPRYFLSIKFPLRNADHSVRGLCGIATEITQRKEDERRIQELATQLERERNDARATAITDELTQLANRRQFDRALTAEFYRLKRSGAPLSLIMIDVDHFKAFNDRYGHPAGDDCLRRIAGALKSVVGRGADLAARYGGEEFAVILPETGLDGAELLAERLRAAVQDLAIPHQDNSAAEWVTISLGVVSRGVVTLADPDPLIELADVAMYQAKRAGRNRVASAAADGDRPDLVRLVWREAVQSGHPAIDTQHRKLFDRANTLLSTLLEGRPKPECTQRIHELLEEIMNHFRDEEDILREARYPGVVAHTRCHTELLAKAVGLAGQFERDQLQLGELFIYLAHEVVAQHMFQEDRAFFPYL